MTWIQEAGAVCPRVRLVDALLFGAPRSMACYVVQGTERTALIDASGHTAARKLARQLERGALIPDLLVLTHAHWDHAGGTTRLQARFPDLEVVASREAARALARAKDFNAPFEQAAPPVTAVTPVSPGEQLDLGGCTLEVVATPGHTRGDISLLLREDGCLFVGDALGYRLAASVVIPPVMPPEFSEEAFFQSLDTLERLQADIRRVALAHFGVLEGALARQAVASARGNYEAWKARLLAAWEAKPAPATFVETLGDAFEAAGLHGPHADFMAALFGDWLTKGFRAAGFIPTEIPTVIPTESAP